MATRGRSSAGRGTPGQGASAPPDLVSADGAHRGAANLNRAGVRRGPLESAGGCCKSRRPPGAPQMLRILKGSPLAGSRVRPTKSFDEYLDLVLRHRSNNEHRLREGIMPLEHDGAVSVDVKLNRQLRFRVPLHDVRELSERLAGCGYVKDARSRPDRSERDVRLFGDAVLRHQGLDLGVGVPALEIEDRRFWQPPVERAKQLDEGRGALQLAMPRALETEPCGLLPGRQREKVSQPSHCGLAVGTLPQCWGEGRHARGRETDADLARELRVGAGRERGRLFVANLDKAQLGHVVKAAHDSVDPGVRVNRRSS